MRNLKGPEDRSRHKDKNSSNGKVSLFSVPLVTIFVCVFCFCGTCWAYFTANTTVSVSDVKASTYTLTYRIDEAASAVDISYEGSDYEMTSNSCKVTLNAVGTENATGYCIIKIGSDDYYTEQISSLGSLSFELNAATGTKIKFTPKWGSLSSEVVGKKISDNGVIGEKIEVKGDVEKANKELHGEEAETESTVSSETVTESSELNDEKNQDASKNKPQ